MSDYDFDDDEAMEMPEGWNYIAQRILDTFAEAGLDKAYLADKQAKLYDFGNKYECFGWACVNLDSKNIVIFAEKMGMTVAECRQFGDTWVKL